MHRIAASLLIAALACAADVTVHESARAIDPWRVTVEAQAQQLGNDPERIFEFVRDRIRNDSYRGVLRGGRGTLLAEAGNSLDKAILLREILGCGGHSSRLAHGQIDAAAQGRRRKGVYRLPRRAEGEKVDPTLAAFLASIQTETRERYATVMKALSDGAFVPPRAPAPIDEGTDHYWVQLREGDDWVDLDPCFPEFKRAQTATEAKETLPVVPQSLFHRLTLKVTLEEEKEGSRVRRTLLTYEANSCDLSGVSLLLTHQEASWEQPQPMESLAAGLSGAFGAIAGHAPEDRVKPVLVVGQEYKAGEAFDLLHPEHEDPSAKESSATGLGALDEALDEDQRVMPPTLGEWIEIEFRSPDGKVDRTERVVFDRVGFAARLKGVGEPSMAPLGIQHPLTAFFCLSFYTGPLASEAIYATERRAADSQTVAGEKQGDAYNLQDALAGVNHAINVLSDQAVSPLRVGEEEVLFCHVSPRLIISSIRSSGAVGAISVDLRRAAYRPLCRTEGLEAKAFEIQLLRGIADGVIEARVVDFLFPREVCGEAKVEVHESATEVFREAARGGVGTRLWKGDPSDLPAGIGEEAAARLAADASAGALIVLPERPITLGGRDRIAWWRIDPTCGDALGVTEDGLHGVNGIEYISIVRYRAEGIATIAVYYAGGHCRAYQYPVQKLLELVIDCHFFKVPWNMSYR